MGASATLARTWLRRNVASTVLLVVLVALVVGAAGGAFAGARRSASSLDRLLEYNRPPHAQVSGGDDGPIDVAAVTSLPQVSGWATGTYALLTAQGPGGGPFTSGDVNPFVPIAAGGDVPYRPYVVEGREPRPDDPHELALDEEAARRLGASIGDAVTLRLYTPDQMESLFDGGDFPPPEGAVVETTVAGIVRHAFDVTPGRPEDVEAVQLASSEVYPTIAFWDRYGDGMAGYGDGTDGVEVRLEGGPAAVPAFEAQLRELPGGETLVVEQANDAVAAVSDARQAVRFEAAATALFGAVALVAGLALVGQALARQVRAELEDRDVLRAMGLSATDVAGAALLRMAAPVGVGCVAGFALAVASSSALPFGTARKAEIDPGVRIDLLPLVATAALAGALLLLWTHRSARRTHRSPAPRTSLGLPGRLAATAARAGAPLPVTFGLSQLGGHRGVTPVRSSLGSIATAMAAVVAIGVYATTADRFVERPEEHGWAWDVLVGDSDSEVLATRGDELLASEPGVRGFASIWGGSEDLVQAGDADLAVVGIDPLSGGTYVQLREGRPATDPGEVVLGWRSLAQLGAHIGDEVVLEGPAGRAGYTVVGSAVLHQLVNDEFELAEGAVTSLGGLERLFGDQVQLDRFMVDLEAAGDRPAVLKALRDHFGPTVATHVPPLDVASLEGTRQLPLLLGAVIAVIGAGSLVHLLLVTVARRRLAFAVVRALGARPTHVTAAVASMATATVVGAAVVGVPVGVVAGRAAWRLLADGLGAGTVPVVPVTAVAAGALVIVVAANAIAAVPGARVRRSSPVDALRTE